tara:strand:+ start:4807 stop:5748 length:942 start_codon:yes stop_codon:yes gene_type:complete
MATRIENILLRARDTLADPNSERWSDDRLLRILDEGQKDLAKQTKILKGQHEFVLEIGVHTYTLPENLWLIVRASFDSEEIRLLSYDNMDEQMKKQRLSRGYQDSRERGQGYSSAIDYAGLQRWELDESDSINALIYDNRNLNEIRVYPIPNAQIAENNYPFENAGNVEFAGDEYFGVVTDLTGEPDYTFDTPFGVVTQLFDPSIKVEQIDDFGVVTDIIDSEGAINIWYIRTPDTIVDVLDSLEIPTMFDVALKHYVVSQAFRDDLDVQYRDMAAESMQLYVRELDVAQETNRRDGTRNAINFTSTYRGAFE